MSYFMSMYPKEQQEDLFVQNISRRMSGIRVRDRRIQTHVISERSNYINVRRRALRNLGFPTTPK